MRKRNRVPYIILFVSFLLAGAGLYMANDAYYKKLGAVVAANQIKFFRAMPYVIKNETLSMPLYQENPILDANKNLKAVFTGSYYNGAFSIRQVKITVYRDFGFQKTEFSALVDARYRQ